jgi:hypothetical protein
MASEPAIHIAIRVGDALPSVFTTALNGAETRRLAAWLSEHPELDALVREALRLGDYDAGSAHERGWPA